MKIELKSKESTNEMAENIYSFMLEDAIGVMSEGDRYIVLFNVYDSFPEVFPVGDDIDTETMTLSEMLIRMHIIDKESDLKKVYKEDEYELIFKEV